MRVNFKLRNKMINRTRAWHKIFTTISFIIIHADIGIADPNSMLMQDECHIKTQ